jgi:hypothetical protein
MESEVLVLTETRSPEVDNPGTDRDLPSKSGKCNDTGAQSFDAFFLATRQFHRYAQSESETGSKFNNLLSINRSPI